MIPDENAENVGQSTVETQSEWRPAPPIITMRALTDPEAIAEALKFQNDFYRNVEWWNANHRTLVTPEFEGKYVAVAGQELFVADTRCGNLPFTFFRGPNI